MKNLLSGSLVALACCACGLTGALSPAAHAASTASGAYGGADIMSTTDGRVTGAAVLLPSSGGLKVVISVSGLLPLSSNTAQIATGVCRGKGTAKYALTTLVADQRGNATAATVIKATAVAATGWRLTVNNGKSGAPLACGAISAPAQVVSLSASAKATIAGKTLIFSKASIATASAKSVQAALVITYITGSAAGAVHPEFLYSGSCGNTGKVLFPLTNLVADATGTAVAATLVSGTVPGKGAYINIHAPTFAVQACGNLGAAQ